MKKSKFTEEQITYAIRQVEAGKPATEMCRELGISEQTFSISAPIAELWIGGSCIE